MLQLVEKDLILDDAVKTDRDLGVCRRAAACDYSMAQPLKQMMERRQER